jgi:DNA-binding transcriptional LysR family regulator
MELRQLEYFVAVVEEANFSRAAARLHVAQPGVSAQIRQLERELGEPLLDRSGRTVRLTDAGAVALPYARAALSAAGGVRQAVDELAGLVRGRVAVGMIASWSAMSLPDVLADFHHRHPAVAITLSEANSSQLLVDLALIGLAGPPPPGIEIQVVLDVPLVAVVSRDDPLAAETATTLGSLGERALMCLPRGTGMRAALDRACASAGVAPRVSFEASEPMVLAHLAGRGLGVAILPESVTDGQSQLRAIPVTGPEPRSRLALAWSTATASSPAARALIAHARAAIHGRPAASAAI